MAPHSLIDHLNTAVLVLDGDRRIDQLNPAAEALLNLGGQRLQGAPIELLLSSDSEALIKLNSYASETYTRRQSRWQLPGGQAITVDFTVTPLSDNELLLEVVPVDRLLKLSNEQSLVAAQATTRNLIRGLAHEIKNPLGGIRGAAQLLEKELQRMLPSADYSEYTQVIIDETDRLRNLVDRMLGPRKIIKRAELNVHEVLERVAGVIRADSCEKLTIVRDYDPSLPDIQGDSELLIQALLNIARNAQQALAEANIDSPELILRSRIQRRFSIGTQLHPLVCRIDICDNGPGIAADLKQTIFYPMISGRAEGTGLGLSIAQELVGQHGGLIECDSEPGATCFSIFLPYSSAH